MPARRQMSHLWRNLTLLDCKEYVNPEGRHAYLAYTCIGDGE